MGRSIQPQTLSLAASDCWHLSEAKRTECTGAAVPALPEGMQLKWQLLATSEVALLPLHPLSAELCREEGESREEKQKKVKEEPRTKHFTNALRESQYNPIYSP